jgi:putative transposase
MGRKSQFTQEQIIRALQEVDAGAKPEEVCRRLGVSDTTFYRWKSKYGGMDVSEAKRLKELETGARERGIGHQGDAATAEVVDNSEHPGQQDPRRGRERSSTARDGRHGQRARVHQQGPRPVGVPAEGEASLHPTRQAGGERDVESFNGSSGRVLEQQLVRELLHAQTLIETWRADYNQVRPHSSLDGQSPQEFEENFNQRGLPLRVA